MDLTEVDEQPEPPDDDVVEVDPTGRFLRYDEIVGTEAFKIVYKAFDSVDGIEVAWTQVRIHNSIMDSSKAMEQLNTEIRLLKSLRHKNIVKFYASWIDKKKKIVNIITELFTSGSLREYRTKHTKVDMKAMWRWAKQVLTGLEYLHSQKPAIIHRDLKCDNIFINGNHGEVKIGNFGLATVMQQQKLQSLKGTVEFMAPELYGGNYNELVDIYAFGMCMLEMVTGEYPYSECQSISHVYKNISEGKKPAALSKVSDPKVRCFTEKCLAPAANRLSARELLKSSSLQNCIQNDINKNSSISVQEYTTSPVHSHPNLEAEPILASMVENVTNHGKRSFSLVLHKSELQLRGNITVTNPVTLSLRIPDRNGVFQKIEFPLEVDKDNSVSVAIEMVEQLELPQPNTPIIAELIDAFLLNLISGWKPSVNISEVIFEDMQSYINTSRDLHFMNCRQSTEPQSARPRMTPNLPVQH